MKTILLQFPSLPLLLDYLTVIEGANVALNGVDCTLQASLTDAELELALAGFGAVLLQGS